MLNTLLAKVFGTQNARTLKTLTPLVAEINAREAGVRALSDADLRGADRAVPRAGWPRAPRSTTCWSTRSRSSARPAGAR